jgi:hypothetical protein
MPQLDRDFAHVPQGSSGRWDALDEHWFNLNGASTAAGPAVEELAADHLRIRGDYSYDNNIMGKGMGTILVDLILESDHAGKLTLDGTGDFLRLQFTAAVRVSITNDPALQYVLTISNPATGEVTRFVLAPFAGSDFWYPGVQLTGPDFSLAFESIGQVTRSPGNPRDVDSRPPPGT